MKRRLSLAFLALPQVAYAAEEHEVLFLGQNAEFFVSAGIAIFLLFLIFRVKVHKLITKALDDRIAQTVKALDDAKQLRADADALLAQFQQKQAEAAEDAKAIIASAEVEAQTIVANAKQKADELVARRQKMAEDRIAAAERAAMEEVRTRAAESATQAARKLLEQKLDSAAKVRLVDTAIGELERKLH